MRYFAYHVRGKGPGANREEVQILNGTPPFSFRPLLLTILNDAVELCYFAIQLDEIVHGSAVALSLLFWLVAQRKRRQT